LILSRCSAVDVLQNYANQLSKVWNCAKAADFQRGSHYTSCVSLYRCLHGQAPRYLADHLITASGVASRLRLRSANRHQLIVPRCRLNTLQPSGVFDCSSDGYLTNWEIRCVVLIVLDCFLRLSCVANECGILEKNFNFLRIYVISCGQMTDGHAVFIVYTQCSCLKQYIETILFSVC